MPTNVNIGGASGKTWAYLRAPLLIGSGYRGTWPMNQNWSTAGYGNESQYSHSSGFPDPKSELLKAILTIENGQTSQSTNISLGSFIGCSQLYVEQIEEGVRTWLFLGCGDATYQDTSYNPSSPSLPREEVWTLYSPNFDTNLMRQNFVGWTVNVTTAPYIGATPVDWEFQITEELFPDDPGGGFPLMQRRGQKFAEIITPYGSQPAPLWWTINSITPP